MMRRPPTALSITRNRLSGGTPASAFTLIEILCATGIAAMILVGVYSIFQRSVKTRDYATFRIHEARQRERAANVIRNDLRNAYISGGILATTMEGGAQSQKSRFPGYLRFTATTGKNKSGEAYGDVQQVEYYITEASDSTDNNSTGTFVRALTRDLLATVQEAAPEEQLLSRIQTFEVAFYDGQDWQESWPLTDGTSALPLAVRVRLQQTAASEHVPDPTPLEIFVPLTTQPTPTSSASTTTGTSASAGARTPTPTPTPTPVPVLTPTPAPSPARGMRNR